jgi:hypothetical protein
MKFKGTVFVRYRDVRDFIFDSDLLLFRRRSLISIAGRGIHSHAGKACWWHDSLYCLEVREWFGGRAVALSSQVKRYPGRIDVYESNADGRWEYDDHGVMDMMRCYAGCDYGYRNVLSASLLHLPIVRLFAKPDTDDDAENGWPPFCSQAIALAERIGGNVDVVPHLADRLTEPADLARSPFYRYKFTLVP